MVRWRLVEIVRDTVEIKLGDCHGLRPRNDDSVEGEEECYVILTTPVGRTSHGHSERASAMEKPTGDGLRHRTATFWFSILRVSTAIARAKTTFPDAAS